MRFYHCMYKSRFGVKVMFNGVFELSVSASC